MSFELDHFFVAIPDPGAGSEALLKAGLLEGPSRDHTGQGTASRGVFFENAYLELIWLTDVGVADSPPICRTRLRERTDPEVGACPFGIGLRAQEGSDTTLPFPTWEYRPPYIPEGSFIPMGRNSGNLGEPLLFFLPWRGGPGWDPPDHPNGVRRVTGLSVNLRGMPSYSPELASLAEAGMAEVATGEEYLMEVELDGGRQGHTVDFCPEIPLRLSY